MKLLLANLRRTFLRFQEHEGARIAASIAFFVLFSAVPSGALLILSVGWTIHDPHEQAHLLGHMLELLPAGSSQNRAFLLHSVEAIRKASGGISLLGVLGLTWSSLGTFSAARWGLNRAWGVRGRGGFVRVRARDFVTGLGIWALLVVSAASTAGLHVLLGERQLPVGGLPTGPDLVWASIEWTMPALLSFGGFFFVYWYVPNVTHRMRDVLPAALVATGMFEASKYLFGLYVSMIASRSSLFGALGGILGFMLWVYVCSAILLLGAEFASVYRRQRVAASISGEAA
jgi:membrane protein